MNDNLKFLLSQSRLEAIEDAIMLDRRNEFAELIATIGEDDHFPVPLRHDLEALFYFRSHYRHAALNETDRKKVVLMDAAWAMGALNKLRAIAQPEIKSA